MKTIIQLFVAILFTAEWCSVAWGFSDFAAGNIVVLRIGDGVTPLSASTSPVTLVEYTISGSLVQSVRIDSITDGARLTVSGTSTSEGHLQRSTDGRYLTFGGYDAKSGTASVGSTNSSATNRIIARVDCHASVDYSTKITDNASPGNLRSTATTDGSGFWAATSSGGVKYLTFGNTGASIQLSTSPTNTRVVNIFNNQLYITSSSGSIQGLATIGSGVPTTSGQTTTIVSGFPTTSGPSPYAFAISSDGSTAYVADDRSLTSGGGVQKWLNASGTWSLTYTLNTNLTVGIRGLLVDWSGTSPVIYASEANLSGNHLWKITDEGVTSAFTSLVTAPPNCVFRGVAFAPLSGPLPVQLTSLTACAYANFVEVRWNTATEVNNYGFEIERKSMKGQRTHANNQESTSGDWNTVGFVPGNGTSNTPHDYTFRDIPVAIGHYGYRLRQVDSDGKFEYSSIVEATVGSGSGVMMLGQNYPNPFNPTTCFPFTMNAFRFVSLKVFDLLGREIATLVNEERPAGSYTVQWDASRLSSGVYFYRLTAGSFSETKKLLVSK